MLTFAETLHQDRQRRFESEAASRRLLHPVRHRTRRSRVHMFASGRPVPLRTAPPAAPAM